MFEHCYLTFQEKFVLFTFQFRKKDKDKFKKSKFYDVLVCDYGFLEEFRSHTHPPVIRLSDKGRKYIMYRREKRFDSLILPVTVSVAASLISTALLNLLL